MDSGSNAESEILPEHHVDPETNEVSGPDLGEVMGLQAHYYKKANENFKPPFLKMCTPSFATLSDNMGVKNVIFR